jgi:hypothetical protein
MTYVQKYKEQQRELAAMDFEEFVAVTNRLDKHIQDAKVTDTLVADLQFIYSMTTEWEDVDHAIVEVQNSLSAYYDVPLEDLQMLAMDNEGIFGTIINGIISLVKAIFTFIGKIFGICESSSSSDDKDKEDKIVEALSSMEELLKEDISSDKKKAVDVLKRLVVEISIHVMTKSVLKSNPQTKGFVEKIGKGMDTLLHNGIVNVNGLSLPETREMNEGGKTYVGIYLGTFVSLQKDCSECNMSITKKFGMFELNDKKEIINLSGEGSKLDEKVDITKVDITDTTVIKDFFKGMSKLKEDGGIKALKKETENVIKALEKDAKLSIDELPTKYDKLYKSWSDAKGANVDKMNDKDKEAFNKKFMSFVMAIHKTKAIMFKEVGGQLGILVKTRDTLYKQLKDLKYIK